MGDLSTLSVKELRALGVKHKVDLSQCIEKGEMVAALSAKGVAPAAASAAAPTTPASPRDTLLKLSREELEIQAKLLSVDVSHCGGNCEAMVNAILSGKPSSPPPSPPPAPGTPENKRRLGGLSVGRLKAIARSRSVNISDCLEKPEMAARIWERLGPAGVSKALEEDQSTPPATPPPPKTSASPATPPPAASPAVRSSASPPARSCTPPAPLPAKREREESSDGEREGTPDQTDVASPRKGSRWRHPQPLPSFPAPFPAAFSQNLWNLPHDVRGCRSVEDYHPIRPIGEGSFGKVWKAYEVSSKKVFALKQIKMEKEVEGFPVTSLREIDIMMQCHHPNVVELYEVVVGGPDKVYMVMEYLDRDILSVPAHLGYHWKPQEAKRLISDLFSALQAIHGMNVIHRDIKPANLLYSNKGILKLCDFGSARYLARDSQLTPDVCTVWYRCPEALVDIRTYTFAADVWSAGVVSAEIMRGEPMMQGRDEVDQLGLILRMVRWNEGDDPFSKGCLKALGAAARRVQHDPEALKKYLAGHGDESFVAQALSLDPSHRPAAADLLQHPFLTTAPLPASRDEMPKFK